MKVERHRSDKGEYCCFSISNTYLSHKGAVRVVEKCPGGVEVLKRPKLFSGDNEFCVFQINNIKFTIDVPWGDSSEYDIVCSKPDSAELEVLAKHFESHKVDPLSIARWV